MEIRDYDIYTERMMAGMEDKLWFIPMLDKEIDTIIDFGCADGIMLDRLARNPELSKYTFIGIDIDDEMIERASERLEGTNVYLYHSIEECMKECSRVDLKGCAIVFSSVVHEIVHYGSMEELQKIIKLITDKGVSQYFVRDMALPDNIYERNLYPDALRFRENPLWKDYLLSRGERLVGRNYSMPLVYEFLLKYRYVENWERERDERYFPAPMSEMLTKLLPEDNYMYAVIANEHYINSYISKQAYIDWGFRMLYPTHYKLAIKRIA